MFSSLKSFLWFLFSVIILFLFFWFVIWDGYLIFNDYPYFFNYYESLSFAWNSSFLWDSQLQVFSSYFLVFIYKLVDIFNVGWDVFSKIMYIISLLLLYISGFLIVYDLSSKNFLYALFWGFFAFMNNFIFEQIIVFPVYSILNLVALYWIVYFLYSLCYKWKKLPIFFYFLPIFLFHPFRFAISFIFVVFFIFMDRKNLWFYFRFIVIGLLVNFYWIIPLVISLLFSSWSSFYNGNLDVVADGYSSWTSVVKNILFLNYGLLWSNLDISLINYLYYFVFLWLLIYGVLIKNRKQHRSFSFFIIWFLFLNFALWPNSPITWKFFSFCFDHVPWFSMFRSYTRFLGVALPIFLILFFNIKFNKYFLYLLLWLFFSINSSYFLKENLWWLISVFSIPKEYSLLKTQKYKRFLIYPFSLYEGYYWTLNSNSKAYSQMLYFQKYWLKGSSIYDSAEKNLSSKYPVFNGLSMNLLTESFVSLLPHDYLIVHKDSVNILDWWSSIWFEDLLYSISADSYSLVMNGTYFNLYERKNILSNINFSWNSDYFQTNPTKYKLSIKNLSWSQELSFLQSFHPERKLYPSSQQVTCDTGSQEKYNSYTYLTGEAAAYTWIVNLTGQVIRGDSRVSLAKKYTLSVEKLKSLNPAIAKLEPKQILVVGQKEQRLTPESRMQQTGTGNITECINEKYTFFEWEELKYLREKPVFDHTHQLVNDYANGRTLDAEYIKQNFPKEYYQEKPDGSIDVNLTLYFKPQSYFYLWLGVSGLTFLGLLTWLVIDWRREKKKWIQKHTD